MRVAWLTILLFGLFSGSVAACSLAGPVAGPGHFYLYDTETGAETAIAVRERHLGASCELSNPFAFDGGRFAWVEGQQMSRGGGNDLVYLRDVASGKESKLVLHGYRHELLSLHQESLFRVTRQESGRQDLWRYDLVNGTDRRIPLALPQAHFHLAGAVLAWQTLGADETPRFHAYDAASSRYILRDQSQKDLGLPRESAIAFVSRDWIVFDVWIRPQSYLYAYEVATQQIHKHARQDLQGFGGGMIRGDDAFSIGPALGEDGRNHLQSMHLRTGVVRDHGAVPHGAPSRVAVAGQVVVVAAYAYEDAHEHEPETAERLPPLPPERAPIPPLPLPSLAPVAVLLSLAGVAASQRGRR